jgi:hypothetical protein
MHLHPASINKLFLFHAAERIFPSAEMKAIIFKAVTILNGTAETRMPAEGKGHFPGAQVFKTINDREGGIIQNLAEEERKIKRVILPGIIGEIGAVKQ